MIPDPDNPNQALDNEGHINYAVRLYPLTGSGAPTPVDFQRGHVVGWALPLCFRCGKQHPEEDGCEPRT